MEGASECLKVLQTQLCPTAQKLKHSVGKLLKTSKKNRVDSLISKTVAVSTGGVGTTLTIVTGIVTLAVTTGGVALLALAITGASLGALGAVAGATTRIVDNIRRKKFVESLKMQVEIYLLARKEFFDELGKYAALERTLTEQMEGYIDPVTSNPKYVTQWLKLKQFTDSKIEIEDLEPGDHIYRRVGKYLMKKFGFHHGIYLGDGRVAEFTTVPGQKSKPQIIGIDNFFDTKCPLFRRNYNGFELPLEETRERAFKIVKEEKWESYGLYKNNCEHFATFLKLQSDIMFSGQARKAKKIGEGIVEGVGSSGKTTQGVFDGLLIAGSALSRTVVSKTAGAAGVVSRVVPGAFAYTLTGVIGAPILTAVDIGFLVHDFKSEQPDITKITVASQAVDDIILYLEKLEQTLRLLQ